MLPGAFVTLDALPLTPNGKLDRNALPPPDLDRAERTTAYVAPRTQIERTLADLWTEILGLERVGIHDNFFTLGGDSIRGIQVVARARKIGLALAPAHLFVHQTIAELAHVATAAAPPEPVVETSDAPLIDLGQQQLANILAQTARPARRP
jgi:aryl carrier-like protein